MNRTRRTLFFGMVFVLGSISQARAGIIYNNGGIGPPLNSGAFQSQGTNRVADNFALTSPNTIGRIEFWGTYFSSGVIPGNEGFTVRVRSNSAGSPGAVFATSTLSLAGRTDTGFDHNGVAGANILKFVGVLTSPILIPDTSTYWLELFSTSTSASPFVWQEISGGTAGTKARSTNSGTSWTIPTNGEDVAFTLANPEPSSFVLLALGVTGFGTHFVRRRRRQGH